MTTTRSPHFAQALVPIKTLACRITGTISRRRLRHYTRSRQQPPSTMRTLIVLAALVAAASAQIHASSVAKAKKGCDFGVPINGDIGWVKVPCDKTNQAAKAIGLGEGAEFLGSSRLSGFVGAESYAIHGKIDGKCCSQRVTKIAGTATEHPFKAQEDELCCHETCPTWMEKC